MYKKTKIIIDGAMVLILYLGVLLIQPISNKIIADLGEETVNIIFNSLMDIFVIAAFMGLLAYLIIKKKKINILLSYVWLIVFFMISLYFLINVEFTKDRLHFLGYGILSFFLYRALRHNIATNMLYVWSSVIIMLFALLDETLQMFGWGGRSFELKDVGIDWLSGLMGQFLIALVARPKLESVDIKIRKYIKDLKKIQGFSGTHLKNLKKFSL